MKLFCNFLYYNYALLRIKIIFARHKVSTFKSLKLNNMASSIQAEWR